MGRRVAVNGHKGIGHTDKDVISCLIDCSIRQRTSRRDRVADTPCDGPAQRDTGQCVVCHPDKVHVSFQSQFSYWGNTENRVEDLTLEVSLSQEHIEIDQPAIGE
ncbi:MAG TPA: hypothetical protein VI636_09490 [Candidatus Angelobacter sp.]